MAARNEHELYEHMYKIFGVLTADLDHGNDTGLDCLGEKRLEEPLTHDSSMAHSVASRISLSSSTVIWNSPATLFLYRSNSSVLSMGER